MEPVSESDVRISRPGEKLTYDDLVLVPEDGQRHELIDGEHHSTPSPNAKHQQVVLNLLVNACQAMAGVADVPRVLSVETVQATPGSIEITVADTGAGVAEPELERIFEPFVSSKADGLGMGLSINRSIVEAHGGQIVATRNPDRGLTLHVTLPTVRARPANRSDPSPVPGSERGPIPAQQHTSR